MMELIFNTFDALSCLAVQCLELMNSEVDLGIIKINFWEIIGGAFIILIIAMLVKKFVPLA